MWWIGFILHYFVPTILALADFSGHALTDVEYKYNMGEGFVFFEVLEPTELQYTFKINPTTKFGGEWNTTFNGIGLVPTDPLCGCGSYRNADEVEGKIALIDRGECSFVSKVIKASEAGAVAAIVTDQSEDNDDLFILMQDDTTGRMVDIPAGFLLGKDGQIIRKTLTKLGQTQATINIPVNISSIPLHKLKQPPWLVW